MKKITPKLVDKIFLITAIGGMLVAYAGVYSETWPIAIVGIVAMICAIIFKTIFYRCPYCGRFLGRNCGEFCTWCGKKVD